MPKLTVTIIARDEAAHIAAALTSVAWADERIVVDSGSTDDTIAIARPLATRVEVREWPGYGAQKNAAAALASHDWVLSLDADERVSPALAAEIQRVLTAPTAAAYRMPRVAWYLGPVDPLDRLVPRFRPPSLRPRARDLGRRVRPRIAASRRRRRRTLRRARTSPVRRRGGPPGTASTTTRRSPRRRCIGRAGAPACGISSAIRWPRSCATDIARGGFKQGGTGLVVSLLNATYVLLKFAKLYECTLRDTNVAAPGTTSSRPTQGPSQCGAAAATAAARCRRASSAITRWRATCSR